MATRVSHISYDPHTQYYRIHFVEPPSDQELAGALYKVGEFVELLTTVTTATTADGERTVQFAILPGVPATIPITLIRDVLPPRYPMTVVEVRITVAVLNCGAHTYVQIDPDFAPGLEPRLVDAFRRSLGEATKSINMGQFVPAQGAGDPSPEFYRVVTVVFRGIGTHVQHINPQFAYKRDPCTLQHPQLN